MKVFILRFLEIVWGVLGLFIVYLGLVMPLLVLSVSVEKFSEGGLGALIEKSSEDWARFIDRVLPLLKDDVAIIVIGAIILIPYLRKRRWRYSLGLSSAISSVLPLWTAYSIYFVNESAHKIQDDSRFQLDTGENLLKLITSEGIVRMGSVNMWLGIALLVLGISLIVRQYSINKAPNL